MLSYTGSKPTFLNVSYTDSISVGFHWGNIGANVWLLSYVPLLSRRVGRLSRGEPKILNRPAPAMPNMTMISIIAAI